MDVGEIRPYLFEPENSTSGSESGEELEVDDESGEERLENTNWCQCGCRQPMPTARESICYQEIDNIRALLVDDPVPACITQHLDFQSACLRRAVLTIAYHSHRFRYGTGDIPTDENRKFRYLAYRQLAWWGWNYLGRHRRVVLPSCTVARIRNEFPSEDYTDHQHPPRTP